MSRLATLIAIEKRGQRTRLWQAAVCAASVAAASVLLLGLSGWFITAAAFAGTGGTAVAHAFNYLLPSAGIRLLAIVRTGARYGERLTGHAAAFGVLARLRPALFKAIAASPPAKALTLGHGEATARLIGDIDAIELRIIRRSGLWGVAAALISGMALTACGGWSVAIATLACAGTTLLFGHVLATRLEEPGCKIQLATGILREEVAMLGSAAAELRCFALEDWAASRLVVAGDALADAQAAQAAVAGRLEMLHAMMMGVAAAAALLLTAQAGAPIAALAALAAMMTVDAVAPVLRGFAERGRLREAELRLDALFGGANVPSAEILAIADKPSIEIDGHCFAHGSRVAIIGESGCGKTTLLESLLGLRGLDPMRVTIDGIDAASIQPAALRKMFAWSPQDAALLSGTVRDNLLLSAPDANDAQLWEALADAGLDAVVKKLPAGLDEWLGGDGARLSGGERRRLSLARAYLAPAPWLLLDEPTEGLDLATEKQVAERLSARLDRTRQGLFLVSHRPAVSALCKQHIEINRKSMSFSSDVDANRKTCSAKVKLPIKGYSV